MKFKIDDRVRVVDITETDLYEAMLNEIGTIREVSEIHGHLGIEFDKNVGGHTLESYGYSCRHGHGYYVQLVAAERVLKLEGRPVYNAPGINVHEVI